MPVPLLDTVSQEHEDPLLSLIREFREDSRPGTVDLGVGVYRDETGRTPIFEAVKRAERALCETQATKAYVGPAGDIEFAERLWNLAGGDAVAPSRVAGMQTVGGSGALRLAADLLHVAGCRQIRVGLPTWPNHMGIFGAAGLAIESYPAFDVASQAGLFSSTLAAFHGASPGTAVLLHGCCHNPTGMTLSLDQWRELTAVIADRALIPLVDLAYQGLGQGLSEDVAGLRILLAGAPTALVALSASKTFGLYRERTGAIFAVASSPRAVPALRSQLQALARATYSMPPDHGAAVVRTILADDELGSLWQRELAAMRTRIARLRRALAEACAPVFPALRAIAEQEGLFSMLPLTGEQVERLKQRRGIYMPASGRINVAGLREADVAAVAEAITQPLRRDAEPSSRPAAARAARLWSMPLARTHDG